MLMRAVSNRTATTHWDATLLTQCDDNQSHFTSDDGDEIGPSSHGGQGTPNDSVHPVNDISIDIKMSFVSLIASSVQIYEHLL